MANNDYITTDCKLTVSKNTAKLDEEIFLYKNDRNIKLLIEIVDNKYRYKSDDLSNLLVKYKASYAQVKWYKNAEVKKEFPIQATDDGKVVFVIEGQLIDEDTELGDYDLQLRLLNESQESIRSLPIIKGAVHILKPLFEEGDIATVNSAVADVSMLSLDGDAIDTYNSDGTYNQTNWGNGDVISSAKLNKLEKVAKDNVDKVNKTPAKSIVEGGKIYLTKEDGTKLDSGTELPAGGTGTSYDDTEIKSDINTIKTDLGTEELTTTAKDVKGAVNEVAAQYKDIAKKVENVGEPTQEQINAAIDKAIEEGRITGSGGINSTAKTLLETILRNAIYTTDQSANITSLVSALSSGNTPTTTHYTITNTLTKCTNGNSSSSVAKNTSYIATITPNNGYKLDTVTVTMGGVDVTSTVYNNGKITINSVTGNIVITATAIEKQDVAEMPTNGLVALFDKDSEVITNGAYPEYQYQIKSKQGDYILGSWNKQVSETTNYGVRAFKGDLSSDKKIDTTIESPTTWVVCSYLSTISCNGYAPNNLGNLGSNSYFISANPLYINTNNESVSSEDISSFMGNRSVGYHRFILVIDGNYLKIYKNAKLIKTLNGSDFSNFSKWKTPTGITGGFSNGVYTYFEAIYNRALSDVEVVELDAYIQTLEVNK